METKAWTVKQLRNGYRILRSTELKKFKDLSDARDTNVVSIDSKTSQHYGRARKPDSGSIARRGEHIRRRTL